MEIYSEIPPEGKYKFRQKYDSYSTSEDVMRDVDVTGKVYLVTGATTGLGYYSSLMLAKKGATVVITARSQSRLDETLKKLSEESGSTLIRGLVMDQLDLTQVSAASKKFISWDLPLHGLLLNAGIFGGEYLQSAQGHEATFAVNHLSHHLMAELLIQKLKDTATESDPARLVILSSESHRHPKLRQVSYAELSVSQPNYWSMLQYNRSKFCNILHTTYLARKLYRHNVHVNAIHPGNMVKTDIKRQWWGWRLIFWLTSPFTKSCSQGAATQLFALTHPDARELSGVYFNHCCPCEPIPAATDFQNALELESLSQNLIRSFR